MVTVQTVRVLKLTSSGLNVMAVTGMSDDTVSVADAVAPPDAAVTVAATGDETKTVVIGKVAVV